jgi:acetyltransferase
MKIATLDSHACDAARDQLAHLLLDALASGPTLGFWPSLDIDGARRYWLDVGRSVAGGTRLLVTALEAGRMVGAAQLTLCRTPDAGSAELRNMIVHSTVRRRGIGGVLTRALEAEALARGRDRVFLDAAGGSGAAQLYRDLGYVPDDALAADGVARRAACTRYRKQLLAKVAA